MIQTQSETPDVSFSLTFTPLGETDGSLRLSHRETKGGDHGSESVVRNVAYVAGSSVGVCS